MMFQHLSLAQLHGAGLHDSLLIGSLVGARRWPYVCAHPSAWLEPHQGVILKQNDIRAWTSTIAFTGTPTQAAVDAHVGRLHQEGLLLDEVPVLWSFWTEERVYWTGVRTLVPADEDRRNWRRERSIEFDRCYASHLSAA
jgi:hypothetical protein